MADRQIPELNYLMSLVEKKFHKAVKTSCDFAALSEEIENETNENVSTSTLKRMWGYVTMNPTPRESTLDILSRYVGKKDYRTFCHDLQNTDAFQSSFFTVDFVNARDLEQGAVLEIGWDPGRLVTLKHTEDLSFEVISSVNSKLKEGDKFQVATFAKGTPLVITKILRDGEFTPSYIAGRQDGLTHLRVLKQ